MSDKRFHFWFSMYFVHINYVDAQLDLLYQMITAIYQVYYTYKDDVSSDYHVPKCYINIITCQIMHYRTQLYVDVRRTPFVIERE